MVPRPSPARNWSERLKNCRAMQRWCNYIKKWPVRILYRLDEQLAARLFCTGEPLRTVLQTSRFVREIKISPKEKIRHRTVGSISLERTSGRHAPAQPTEQK